MSHDGCPESIFLADDPIPKVISERTKIKNKSYEEDKSPFTDSL